MDRGHDADWSLLLPPWVRRLPADLAAILMLVGATVLSVFLPVVRETPLRVALGLPFVLFVPGYAFIAALFPEAGSGPSEEGIDAEDGTGEHEDADTGGITGRTGSGIDGIERVALSFGLSIAIVPLIGLVLNFTPFGIRLVPIMVAVSGFTVVATVVAAYRRWDLPADERFRVPYREWIAGARTEMLEPESRADAALNVLLVVSILLAVGSVGYATLVPKEGESFSELYVLTETDDGELVADNYPQNFTVGESKSVVLGIGNHEHATTDYTLVVELHDVRFREGANNTTTLEVTDQVELRRFSTTLGHNETWHQPFNVTPTLVGERLRLTMLLYKGDPPANPTIDNAYRENHLFINVSSRQAASQSVNSGVNPPANAPARLSIVSIPEETPDSNARVSSPLSVMASSPPRLPPDRRGGKAL